MTVGLNNPIVTTKAYDQKDRFIDFISRRVGHCGNMHEGRGKRKNHSKVDLRMAIESCPNCQKALSAAQSQPAVAN